MVRELRLDAEQPALQDSPRLIENLTTMAAAAELLNFDELALEHIQLERRLSELARHLERAVHRAGAFPSEFGSHEVRKLQSERRTILDRLAELSGLLLLVPLPHA